MIQEILSRFKEAEEYYRAQAEIAKRRGNEREELINTTKATEAIKALIMIEQIKRKHENTTNT